MDKVSENEKRIETLRSENEVEDQRLSLAQKKAAIKEARAKYGKDWKKVLGVAGKLKVNKEALQDLHGMGMGGEHLRELNKPPMRGLRRD